MTVEIPRAAVRAIEDHARETYPEECCGVLLGGAGEPRRVVDARRTRNIAPKNRPRRYGIDPLELLRADDDARKGGLELIGIYHSHPDHPSAPSEFDRSRAATWYSYLILSIVDRQPKDLTSWLYDEAAKVFRAEDIVRV